MPDRERQDQIAETLSLLSQMTPTALATNRDELFFRAGEASARGERRGNIRSGRWLWPTAAGVLAMVTAGLGMALVNRTPQLQVVYVERSVKENSERISAVVKDARPNQIPDRNSDAEQNESGGALNEIRRRLASDGLIPRQDWAALSDAFAQQMQLQHERNQAATSAASTTAAGDGDAPRQRARTYLELRDAMRAL